MTDPIRPFVSLVESIARATTAQKSGEPAVTSDVVKQNNQNHFHSSVALSFTERLRTRLSVIDRKDRKKRRHVFIELALLSELGEQLAMDHALGDLIDKVSTLVAINENMISDLDALLDNIDSAPS